MHATIPPGIAAARLRRPEPGFTEFVILVALMMGVTAFAVDAVLPAFPAIGSSFGVADPNRLQLVVYVYMLGFGAAQLVFGPASDVVGRRPAYLAGAVIFLIGSAMAIFAHDLASLLTARFVQGIGAASGRVLATAIVRDRFSGRDMARVMSLNMTVFIMVPIFAPAIGSLLLLLGDWHVMFVAMLATGLALGIWFWLRMPETLAPENKMPFSASRIAGGFGTTLSSRTAMGYATAVGLMFGCVMTMVGSAQQIFTETYGLGSLFPVAFGLLALSMGLAALVNSKAVRRFGMRRISHASMLGLVVVGVVLLGTALLTSGRPPLLLFGILLACAQFLLGLSFPNFNALAMEPLGHVAGTASSLIGVYTTVVGALCGLFIGGSFDGTVMPIAAGYCGLAILAALVVTWTERGRLFVSHHSEQQG
ncbi:multidrug effflux MFS transporter [uncultured Enterovirga sp.]|uniref:multidrug effflux MFS transporter n=1 Tax=uncultured Enterovirga sp. TaxID=2026352 RepID=UPI0035CBB4D6